jgi:hypothetical protein
MRYKLKKEQSKDQTPLISLYDIITRDGYIIQSDYLKLWPESIEREAALLELYKMEQQGLIYGNYCGKNPTFYLADITRH